MFSGTFSRRTLTNMLAAMAVVIFAVPAFGQTGRIQGKVTDEAGKAVDGAKIIVSTIPDAGGQKWEATSDKNSNYIIGTLPKSGNHLLHDAKAAAHDDTTDPAIKISNMTIFNFDLAH